MCAVDIIHSFILITTGYLHAIRGKISQPSCLGTNLQLIDFFSNFQVFDGVRGLYQIIYGTYNLPSCPSRPSIPLNAWIRSVNRNRNFFTSFQLITCIHYYGGKVMKTHTHPCQISGVKYNFSLLKKLNDYIWLKYLQVQVKIPTCLSRNTYMYRLKSIIDQNTYLCKPKHLIV